MRIDYRLRIMDDYMINTGAGTPGVADNAVVRDKDGLPYIPFKTLRGLLRDAVRSLCCIYMKAQPAATDEVHPLWACDGEYRGVPEEGEQEAKLCGVNARQAEEPCIACRLFGAQGITEGKLSFTDARLPQPVRQLLSAKNGQQKALAEIMKENQRQVLSHNSHDPLNRRAREDFFFSFESVAPLGGAFEGRLFLRPGHPPLTQLEAQLLMTAFHAVKTLGAKRRRGSGGCSFSVVAPDEAKTLYEERLWAALATKGKADLEELSVPWVSGGGPGEAEQGQTKEVGALGEQVKLKVTIRADHADLTLTSDQWVSNLARTQEFISGRRVRGVFAAMFYGTRHATAPKSPDAARRLFFSDETRFGDCCIMQDALPVLPMTLSTFSCKHHPPGSKDAHKSPLVDALRGEPPGACQECGAPMERASGWRSRSGYWFGASLRERTGTALKDGTADEGRLFTREGIAQETVLSGEIVTTRELWDAFVAATGMRLGEDIDIVLGSSCPAIMRVEIGGSDALTPLPRDDNAAREVTVTFLSDVLIDDELGEPVTALDDKGLLRALGLADSMGISVEARFQATTRVSGWNATWGLPMGQRPGIAAGSCFRLVIPANAPEDPMGLLRAAENLGIGERRNEGFGRIRVNDPFHDTGGVH